MTREEILEATKKIAEDRQPTYGDAEDNFAIIAAMWETYLGSACIAGNDYDLCINPNDVAAMMILSKIARVAKNPCHLDNWIDIAGYAACGGILGGGMSEEEGDK